MQTSVNSYGAVPGIGALIIPRQKRGKVVLAVGKTSILLSGKQY